MAFEGGLRSYLAADGAVAAVAESLWAFRVPETAPHPSVLVRRISTGREYAHDGPVGWAEVRTQIDCSAEDPDDARRLGNAVRRAVSGYSGAMGSSVVRGLLVADERDLFEESGEGRGLHRVSMDITGFVRETP